MEYTLGYVRGLELALVAITTVKTNPEVYENIKSILETALKTLETEMDKMLIEQEEKNNG